MPKVPKWMANAMEKLFSGSYHPVIVTEIKDFNSYFRQVRFEGDFSKIKKKFIPGNIVEFRITDTEFRHYTPSHFDQKNGICEILFYLHDKGPGSQWASNLQIGDTLKLLGPGGKTTFNYQFKHHLYFGDETSLGFIKCMIDEAIDNNVSFLALTELNDPLIVNHIELNHKIITLAKDPTNKSQICIDYLKKWMTSDEIKASNTVFYLTGNAKSIKNMLKTLKDFKVPRAQIQSEPYWVEHRRGL